ncbi:MAG: siderophore-interacting protein [Phreatobacter sp.]|uniref:siderophore-interacting protein n=1 Tax=Phreatobacter sp. TaxID=1966341 RepID=UPI001A3E717F|nr:siderophore-interacting protein [Phreatobacter sp.]MBL8569740.1 siderophore-interacting protein [Phreatobacter sp.]
MTLLTAEATIPTAAGSAYVAEVCERLLKAEFAANADHGSGRIELRDGLGIGTLEASSGTLRMKVEAPTEQGLSILKFLLSMHVEEVAATEKPEVVWTGDGCGLDVLPSFREMTVLRIADVTPHIRRVTLTGHDLRRFESDSVHVRLLFPPEGLAVPEWPKPGKNGRPVWPPEDRKPAQRVYTIRRIDAAAAEMDIDFVMHEVPGIASGWAAKAEAGTIVGLLGPGGREMTPNDWVLLAGDETAIPAMARILEKLPETTRGVALIEVEDTREVQGLVRPVGVEVRWLFRNGQETGRNTLLADAVMAIEWPTEGSTFAWLGAEEATAKRLRVHWRDEMGLEKGRWQAVSYWTHEVNAGEKSAA